MKTNRIKWRPSMLKKFLIPQNSFQNIYSSKSMEKTKLNRQEMEVKKTYQDMYIAFETSQGTAEFSNAHQEYYNEQGSGMKKRIKIKANRVKWSPSILKKFLLLDYGKKYHNRHGEEETYHTQDKEKLHAQEKETHYAPMPEGDPLNKETVALPDFDEAEGKTNQEAAGDDNLQRDAGLNDNNMPNATDDSSTDNPSNNCEDHIHQDNPVFAPDVTPDGNENTATENGSPDAGKPQEDNSQENISISIKFKIPLKAAKRPEKLEILVNENDVEK